MRNSSEKSSYFIGVLFSLIFHLVGGGLVLVLLESRAANAAREPQVFSVTLKGGDYVGGIAQVPDKIATKEERPLPGSVPEVDSADQEQEPEVPVAEKKLEKPSAVEDREKVAKRKAEEELKKKVEARKAREAAKKKTDQRLAQIARTARDSAAVSSKYKGEGGDGGGRGLGATALDNRGGMGGGTLIDPQKLGYQIALKDHVKKGWRWLPGSKNLRASVLIRMQPNGRIQDVRIEVSSGNSQFDESVVRAVRKADPVPPPPPELYSEFSSVRIRFDSHE